MKKLNVIIAISAALAAIGCSTDEAKITSEKQPAMEMAISANAAPQPNIGQLKFPPPVVKPDEEALQDQSQNTGIEAKIIKEGEVQFETDNVSETRKNILATLKNAGGYVSEDNEFVNGENNQKQYTLSVRIPAKKFDAFLGSVAETATKIDSKNIRIRDITTEYIDTKTRLDNKKALEQRYLALLKQAAKMSDMLEIESKLTDIRSDIESTQGQLNYMDKQVSYSSLSITFYTKQAGQVDTGKGFAYRFKKAIAGGVNFLQGLFFGIIGVWPLWAAILLIVIIVKVKSRKKSRDV